MDDDRIIAVSPRHAVRLAREYVTLVERAPAADYVVRTIARREANGLFLMTAEIVIAGRDARDRYPLAATYPLHFRKTYSLARLHGDTAVEFENQTSASRLIWVPPPIGFAGDAFRSCLVPGRPYQRLTPFGVEPEESNIRVAQNLPLATAAGLWRLAEEGLQRLTSLHAGGLSHGDAELQNFVVCPAPLELVVIDFEAAVHQSALDTAAWERARAKDLEPLLREAIFLQCALGRQEGQLADLSWDGMDRLFRSPDLFRRAIESHGDPTE